ncbi:RHS repeat-associated core domain-containing protein, partial [Acinetobacter seifertii]|uniref:RHS repeat-associated core domain-containing protein n=1 Tax=Acinetobacter seifertii TaxID=1530123 RepID=UPI001D709A13
VDGTVASGVKGKNSIHGFTSHEMLDSIGLIHMNGRVYDPTIGRFISADPTIDGADSLQGYNRYAYVYNNPTTLLDPEGYGWTKFWKRFGKDLANGLNTFMDDWLGTCSKAKGDCGVSVGVTYGPNNQGVGAYNDGRNTIQPHIGFGNVNGNYYTLNYSQEYNGLQFNSLGYNSNGYDALHPQYQIDANYFGFNNNDGPKYRWAGTSSEFVSQAEYDSLYIDSLNTHPSDIQAQKSYYYDGVEKIAERDSLALSVLTSYLGVGSLLKPPMPVLTKNAQKSVNSYQKLIIEHKQKLADYKANPAKYDNQGVYRNAPTKEIQESIYKGRIAALEKQIKKQEKVLKQILSDVKSYME